jgi:hypothetical protein
MAFYPIPFGHAEVRTDPRRPKRPCEYADTITRLKSLKAHGRRSS